MKRLLPLVALACLGADRPHKNYPPEYYPYTPPRAGWLDRADKRLEWYNLGWQLEGVNIGAQGMKNAARDEMMRANGPWFAPRPLSGW
jgi:hypothetical protein